MMLETICAHIHNYFIDDSDVVAGTWTIRDGAPDLSDMAIREGQYYRVVGSALNDGVYQHPATDMADETFYGEVQPMRVPRAVLALVAEIEAWQAQYGAAMASPYQSENVIGVYSYSKQYGSNSQSVAGDADGWKSIFKTRLDTWRKLR